MRQRIAAPALRFHLKRLVYAWHNILSGRCGPTAFAAPAHTLAQYLVSKPSVLLLPPTWMQRMIYLESVAGVPGMVAGGLSVAACRPAEALLPVQQASADLAVALLWLRQHPYQTPSHPTPHRQACCGTWPPCGACSATMGGSTPSWKRRRTR